MIVCIRKIVIGQSYETRRAESNAANDRHKKKEKKENRRKEWIKKWQFQGNVSGGERVQKIKEDKRDATKENRRKWQIHLMNSWCM
jgi:hypothetical protein